MAPLYHKIAKPNINMEELPPDSVKPEDVISAFSKITQDARSRAKLKHAILHNKPSHWSHKSCAPYYRESFALIVKAVLDRMAASGKDQIYYYSDFIGTSPTTIYARFVQGKNYLLENLDPDGKYNSLCECLSVTRRRGVGVYISLRKDILEIEKAKGNLEAFMPKEISESSVDWKDKMEQWIDFGNPQVPFVVTNLALSDDEVEALKLELNDLPEVAANITNRSIKLVKIKQ